MYGMRKSPAFDRDVKRCVKKHWDIKALKEAMEAVLMSDEQSIPLKYKDHALSGDLQGTRELHVGSRVSNWVIIYTIDGDIGRIRPYRTHDEMFKG